MKFERDAQGHLKKTSGIKPPMHVGYNPKEPLKILFGIVKCKFLTPYPHQLDDALSAYYPGYFHMTAYQNHSWDGKHRFITRAGYFPTGLLPVVYYMLKTGNNPLLTDENDDYKVLRNVPENVVIVTEKDSEFYTPGFATFYLDYVDVLESLNGDGTFAYPISNLNGWKRVVDTNPLAKRVLNLARDIHISQS